MNIILLRPSDWQNDAQVKLDDHRARHIIHVLSARCGDTIRVGIVNGELGVGTVAAVETDYVLLDVTMTHRPGPRHPHHLVLALPRPKMLRRVLRTVAEFGVEELHLIHSARVEKSYWQSPLLSAERLESALLAGLERSGDTRMPEVQTHHRFRPFAEDILPHLTTDRDCLIAHPGSDAPLRDQQRPAVILIGPEGGFVPFELDMAGAAGARAVNLGSRVLSVDTAVAAALACTAG